MANWNNSNSINFNGGPIADALGNAASLVGIDSLRIGGFRFKNDSPQQRAQKQQAAEANRMHGELQNIAQDLDGVFKPLERSLQYGPGPQRDQAIADFVRNIKVNGLEHEIKVPEGVKDRYGRPTTASVTYEIVGNHKATLTTGAHTLLSVTNQLLANDPALAQEVSARLGVTLNAAQPRTTTQAPAAGVAPIPAGSVRVDPTQTAPAAPAPAPAATPAPATTPAPAATQAPAATPTTTAKKEEAVILPMGAGSDDISRRLYTNADGTRRVNPAEAPTAGKDQVKEIQTMLGGGLKVDGKWGPDTQDAFAKKCKEANVDPHKVNFTDPKNPELIALMKQLDPSKVKVIDKQVTETVAAPAPTVAATPALLFSKQLAFGPETPAASPLGEYSTAAITHRVLTNQPPYIPGDLSAPTFTTPATGKPAAVRQ